MKKKERNIRRNENIIYGIIFRYILILILSLGNLFIFYKIFTPLTTYPVYLLLKLIYSEVIYSGIVIHVNQHSIFLIKSCVAGSAYFLLTALVFSTPMSELKRIYLLFFTLFSFLLINITRIIFLVILLVNESDYFDISHKLIWYGLSTIFVMGIWFFSIWIFRIKEIPVYSDMKYLIKIIKRGN